MRRCFPTIAVAVLAFASLHGVAARATPPDPQDKVGLPGATPETLTDAKALLRYNGTEDMMLAQFPIARDGYVSSLMRQEKITVGQARMFVDDFLYPEMKRRLGELIDMDAEVIASKLSSEDLRQIASFYASPVGKKLISLKADFGREMEVGHIVWRKKLLAEAWQHFREHPAQPGTRD